MLKIAKGSIATFFEDTFNSLGYANDANNLKRLLIHELFIYTVAYFLKQKDYASAGKILRKTYFNSSGMGMAQSFHMFYCSDHEPFSNAVCQRDDKKYFSGVAQYWTESVNTTLLNQRDFVFGDIMCYNVAVLGQVIFDGWYWFPLTYVYNDRYSSSLKPFAQKLASREHVEKVLPLFGYDTVEQFKAAFSSIAKKRQTNEFHDYRYSGAFDSAPLLSQYVQEEDIGTLR